MKNYFFIIFAFITLVIACRQPITQPNIRKVISDLTIKFPQLQIGSKKQSGYYKMIRSVTREDKSFQIQLYSTPDSIKDSQKIIIIINSKGQNYAIPFLSNTYLDYWGFKFEKRVPNVSRTNSTFEKELITALDKLNLNDTLGTGSVVINEILFSLLHCRTVKEGDSTDLHTILMNENSNISSEDLDSCFARIEKNYKAISSQFHPQAYIYNYNTYWDEENHRIYQFNNKGTGRRKKLNVSIKVYRQDCVCHAFMM